MYSERGMQNAGACRLGAAEKLIATLALFMIAATLLANSPEDYFHTGADRYLDDQLDDALAAVVEGLSRYENDPKLLALKELLERQQEEQDQKDEDREEDQDESDPEREDAEDDEDRDEDQDEEPDEEPDGDPDQDPESEDESEPEPLDPEDLSLEDMLRLLQSLDEDEKAYRDEMRIILGDPEDVEKDW